MISFFNKIGNTWIAKAILVALSVSMLAFWGLGGLVNTSSSDTTAIQVGSRKISITDLAREFEVEREEIEKMLGKSKSEALRADKFVKLVHNYKKVDCLSKKVLNEFIERIDIHQGSGRRYKWKQQIDIYFNYIGQFQVTTSNDVGYISDNEISVPMLEAMG